MSSLEGAGGWGEQSSQVQAVCDWCGPANFSSWEKECHYDLFGGTLCEKQEAFWLFDPVNHITENTPPFLIMHGDKDELVPLTDSERLYNALLLADREATFCAVEGGGHGFTRYDVHVEMLRFFDSQFHVQETGT